MATTALFALMGAACAHRLGGLQALPPSAQADDALDQYGGILVRVAPPSPTFRRAKVGTRWVLVTPEGHAFGLADVSA